MPARERKETKKSLIEQLKKKGCKGYSGMNVPELKVYLEECTKYTRMKAPEVCKEAKRLGVPGAEDMKRAEALNAIMKVKRMRRPQTEAKRRSKTGLLDETALPVELINLIGEYATPLSAQHLADDLFGLVNPELVWPFLYSNRGTFGDPDMILVAWDTNTGNVVAGSTVYDFVQNAKARGFIGATRMPTKGVRALQRTLSSLHPRVFRRMVSRSKLQKLGKKLRSKRFREELAMTVDELRRATTTPGNAYRKMIHPLQKKLARLMNE